MRPFIRLTGSGHAGIGLAILLPLSAARAAEPPCPDPVPILEEGRAVEEVCPVEAARRGLTLVSLGDDWAPAPLSPLGMDPPAYRAAYVALADQRWGDPAWPPEASGDRDFELFGIPPSFGVSRGRLADERRHACHDAVDDEALASFGGVLTRDDATPIAARTAPARVAAVMGLQAHLVCEGWLAPEATDGHWGPDTADALARFRRRHALPAIGKLDPETAAALLGDSRVLDFVALLRGLRARVADASGLIEDGSACSEWKPVLGHWLDASAWRDPDGRPAMAEGAPDLVSAATERAARALGFTDPAAASRALETLAGVPRVALALPPPPPYHSAHMELRVEIDRGDVWYQYPWTASGARRAQPVQQRPALILWATEGESEVALVRWPTTIGGWQREQLSSRAVVMRYKPSSPGAYLWRDLVAAPVWFPPPTTPDRELVRRGPDGRWRAREETIGPSYRSAYGLVMFLHHRLRQTRYGPALEDNGTRTHGTGSYLSVPGAGSHGCHRLLGAAALRLGAFVLAHRTHLVRGAIPDRYRRVVRYAGARLTIERIGRGYLYELTPPIDVRVLEGRVLGPVRTPPLRSFGLPAAR
jgi:Putative peptidoglycan binding domain